YVSPQAKPDALWFGAGIHVALAHYYQPQGKGALRGFRRGPDPLETWAKYCKHERGRFFRANKAPAVDEQEWVDLVDLGQAMLTGYIEEYQGDSEWEFLAPEMPFKVGIPDFEEPEEVMAWFVGTWDGAFRDHADNGECKILETKTASRISTIHLIMEG